MSPLRRILNPRPLLPALLVLLLAFQVSFHAQAHDHDEASREATSSCQLCIGFQGLELSGAEPMVGPAAEVTGRVSLPSASAELSIFFLLPPARGPPARS